MWVGYKKEQRGAVSMTIMHLNIDIELRVRVFEMLLQLHVCYFPFKTLSWYPRRIIFAERFTQRVPNRVAECNVSLTAAD